MSWPASPNTLPAISMLCCHGIGSRPRHHAAKRLNLTASNLKLPCGLYRMLSVGVTKVTLVQLQKFSTGRRFAHQKTPTTSTAAPREASQRQVLIFSVGAVSFSRANPRENSQIPALVWEVRETISDGRCRSLSCAISLSRQRAEFA